LAAQRADPGFEAQEPAPPAIAAAILAGSLPLEH
jgi:hypothetical protein